MKKINESFICINCKKEISQAKKTCRNHCPSCFVSLHVDGDIPGDRNTNCHGKMFPIEYKTQGDAVKILFKCEICGKQHWNKRSVDDEVVNLDGLIKQYREKFE